MKNKKPLIIVLGEPNSIFIEILSKTLNKKTTFAKINYPIIIIGSKKLIIAQLKALKKKLKYKEINDDFVTSQLLRKKIYLIDVEYNFKKTFDIITIKSKNYISNCFQIALKLLNKGISDKIVNGPISKKHFLENKYPGITEFIFDKSKKKISKKPVMLLHNKNLSISPLTTHIPLKKVVRNISKNLIINNVTTIYNFLKKNKNIKPKIAILGINPHCETKSKLNEENLVIRPAINKLKKRKINIDGPFPADTFFINKNISKYDCIIGNYHDQVLTPFKTLYGFDASNLTLGLPFLRMSVDHGPNQSMLGKNKSSPKSLENIFDFINSLK